VRDNPRRLLIGARAGFTHSLGDMVSPRFGIDLTVPLRLGPVMLWISGLISAGVATTVLPEPFVSRNTLFFLPLTARVGAEVWAGRRLSVVIGALGGATWARYQASLNGLVETAWGPALGGYSAVHFSLGPGHAFFEAGYTWAPVTGRSFRAETGGIGFALGYRLGVF
jgi:hypothetical protein